MDVTNYEPPKRSEFNKLQLQFEKLKKPSTDDKEPESDAYKIIQTQQHSASVKAGTHELVHGLHNAIPQHE